MPQLDADPPPPVRSLRYDSDVDMSDSSRPTSPSDSRSTRPGVPRRRRRTIVHLPSDSLFSSSLDFSALMSETERFPRAPASEGSRSPEQHPPIEDLDLGPAFSLNNSPSACRKSTHSAARTFQASGFSVSVPPTLPGAPPSSPSHGRPPVPANPDPDNDELLDLFSVLGLDGECRSRLAVPLRLASSPIPRTSLTSASRGRKVGRRSWCRRLGRGLHIVSHSVPRLKVKLKLCENCKAQTRRYHSRVRLYETSPLGLVGVL